MSNSIIWDKLSEGEKDRQWLSRKWGYPEECELTVPPGCQSYGLKSLTRISANGEVRYVLEGRDELNNNVPFKITFKKLDVNDVKRKFENNEYAGEGESYEYYQRYKEPANSEERMKHEWILKIYAQDIRNNQNEFETSCNRILVENEPRLEVFWEPIAEDIEMTIKQNKHHKEYEPPDRYDDAWRIQKLRKHPEYGKDGEKHFDVDTKNERDQVVKMVQAWSNYTFNPETTKYAFPPQFIEGESGDLIGRIKGGSQQYQATPFGFLYHNWCLCSGTYDDGTFKEFGNLVKLEDLKWHIPTYRRCPNCRRADPALELRGITVPAWDLTLTMDGSSASVKVIGVTRFDLADGDIVVVHGDPDYITVNGIPQRILRCKGIQRLAPDMFNKIIGTGALTATATQTLPEETNIENITRKKMFALYEEWSHTENPIVDYNNAVKELYERKEDIRNADPLNLKKYNKVKKFRIGSTEYGVDIEHNKKLKNFRNALQEYRMGDKGIIKKVGNNPVSFRWYESSNALPQIHPNPYLNSRAEP